MLLIVTATSKELSALELRPSNNTETLVTGVGILNAALALGDGWSAVASAA